jgi:predicted  nucleic acid-binding Zn-ribbon protein
MGVTESLLKLYRIDQQIDGLKSRLRGAEAYLKQQDAKLTNIATKVEDLKSQIRQLEATVHNNETELNGFEERIEKLRDRMNNASTSKEHSAMLVEINTVKADRAQLEEAGLHTLQSLDEMKAQLESLTGEHDEVGRVRTHAEGDRDARDAEIRDRLNELESEREGAVKDVPQSAIDAYEERMIFGIDNVMSPVIEQSRRNMEYTSDTANTVLPIELVNKLIVSDELVFCPGSDAILYLPDELKESLQKAADKKRKQRESVNA